MKQNSIMTDFLTEWVTLEELHPLGDDQGGQVTEWRPLEGTWARIEAQKPGKFTRHWQGERPHFAALYWVWLRAEQRVPQKWRMVWKGRVLMPLSAMTHLPTEEWKMVLVQEVGDSYEG